MRAEFGTVTGLFATMDLVTICRVVLQAVPLRMLILVHLVAIQRGVKFARVHQMHETAAAIRWAERRWWSSRWGRIYSGHEAALGSV